MAEQHPLRAHGLHLLGGDTAPDTATPDGVTPGADTDPTPVSASVSAAEMVPVSAARRAGVALRYRLGSAVAELWLHPDRLIHSLWNGRPESMAAHYRYMTSFAWVPEEVTGKKATAWKWAGIAYHVFVAWPLKAFAKALDAAAGRPLLMLCLIVPVLIIVLLFVL